MELREELKACMDRAVAAKEAAGYSLLIRQGERELCCLESGMADIASGRPVTRDAIFRLYSQTKPITAAAVMLLAERGKLDLMEGVDTWLPGFRNPRRVLPDGSLEALPRAPWVDELLGMTAGLCYPDADPAGQYAARVFEAEQEKIAAGGGSGTVEFCNLLGQQPLAFQPGTHWRYSTCADVLGAVVEAVSGMRFGDFLRQELFEPLGMKDTDFWVPAEKRNRLVTAYRRVPGGLEEYHGLHLAVGRYDRRPAFESGGAGLVSTLDDYMAFARMLMNGGVFQGRRILSEASVRHMASPQLGPEVRRDLWDSLGGYNYGHLLRICDRPGQAPFMAKAGEYGWDGWLGTYFINLPKSDVTFLMFQNTTDAGTTPAVRRCRNILAAHLEE